MNPDLASGATRRQDEQTDDAQPVVHVELPVADPRPAWPTRIGVACRDGTYHAYALEPVAADDVLLQVSGDFVDVPNRYSVQIDDDLHVMPPAGLSPADDREQYRWRFLNHSCRPNSAFRGTLLVAITPIDAAQEVTFDYNTTELEIACPFECHCGHCGGQLIRGFRHLSPAEQRRREPFLGLHLAARLARG